MKTTSSAVKTDEVKAEKMQMTTLVECMAQLLEEGFTENFTVTDRALIAENGEKYNPEQVKVVNFYRFEGESDPADNCILYALETDDKKKGAIADAYGNYADTKITMFMAEVEKISKKNHIPK